MLLGVLYARLDLGNDGSDARCRGVTTAALTTIGASKEALAGIPAMRAFYICPDMCTKGGSKRDETNKHLYPPEQC